MMIPWVNVINWFGFNVAYCKAPNLTLGLSASFSVGNFYISMGRNPSDKKPS